MTEAELKALLDAEQESALGYLGGELTTNREKAMDYYLSKPFGNEVTGRSSVVSSDVADTIEWIMPSLLKIFMGGDDVVDPTPQGEEDEEGAKQASDYANFVFQRDNPGFIILYSMFKDALLQKAGTCKIYWEETEQDEEQEFIELPGMQFIVEASQRQAEGWEIANHETSPDPNPQPGVEPLLHSGAWTRTKKAGKVCIDPVPPEEFLISRKAKSIEHASYVAHRCPKTASELIEAGYPKSVVDKLPSDEPAAFTSGEERARMRDVDEDPTGDYSVANRAMRQIWVTEAYIKVDWDGDGIAEMRKITHAGSGTVILDNEEWEGPRPFAALTPIIMPHRFYGRSVADLVMDLQLIKSTLWRQILDNLYLTNNPQKVADPTRVELDDLLTPRPGGIVRTKAGASAADAVFPLTVEPVASASYPMLEYIDTVRENRTGVTRYNQGTDANSLNKTATGVSQIMTAAQQRIELIARVFAETGVKDIFSLILWLLRRYPDQAKRTIRLRNKQWVAMEPATWKGDYDLVVNVGLGTGNKDQMLGHLTNILAAQKEIIGFQQGAEGPLVTLGNVYKTLEKMVENSGFKSAAEFFTDPATAPPQPPKEPPPDPKMVEAQQKMQIEQQKADQQAQISEQKLMAEIEGAKIKAQADFEIQAMKIRQDAEIKAMEISAKASAGFYEPQPAPAGRQVTA